MAMDQEVLENDLSFSSKRTTDNSILNQLNDNQRKDTGKTSLRKRKVRNYGENENNKENFSKRQKLGKKRISLEDEKIKTVCEKIEESHKEADWVGIYNAFLSFHALKYPESEWQYLGEQLNAYKWPSQNTWKEVVGGQLFFPKKTLEWKDNIYESYHLKRIDNLWAFAIGAKFNHALSKYFLVRMLDEVRSDYTDAPQPKFFENLYRESFDDLKKCDDNSDSCYIIGINYVTYPYLSTTYVATEEDKDISNSGEAIKWHEKGGDLKNKFQSLRVKAAAKALYSSPTADDYLSLAREGYMAAYVNALNLTEDFEERKKITSESLGQGYKYPLPQLNGNKKEVEVVRKSYIKSGENNVPQAFVMLGISYVGEIIHQFRRDRIDLKKVSPKEINTAIKAFTTAGKLKNQEGWNYLSSLYQELYEQNLLGEKEYREKILSSLEEGVKLGSAACYHKSFLHLPTKAFAFFVKHYGYPPQMELRDNIESFLKEKY